MQRAEEFWNMAPKRVNEAANMAEFKKNRYFTFLHLFSGPDDHLAKAIIEGANRAGLEVRCRSLDIKFDLELNLDAEKWKELGEERGIGWFTWGFPMWVLLQGEVEGSEGLPTTGEVIGAPPMGCQPTHHSSRERHVDGNLDQVLDGKAD